MYLVMQVRQINHSQYAIHNDQQIPTNKLTNHTEAKYSVHTYIHTNLYSDKNRENESEALAQDDQTVKADWKRWNFRWRLKVDSVSIERMCAGKEFQVEGADTEKAREKKLLVILAGLVRRFVLEERKDLGGRQ